jgi:ATP-binding cassette, subfamily B, bacterial
MSVLSVRNFMPGRVRLDVASLRQSSALAEALQHDLSGRAGVTGVQASALTGSVLVRCDPAASAADVSLWVREALRRQLQRLAADGPLHAREGSASSRAVVPLPSALPAKPSPLQRLLASMQPHAGLRRRAVLLSLANGLEDVTPPVLVGLAADTVARGSGSLLASFGLRTLTSRMAALAGLSAGFWLLSSLVEYWHDRAKADLANAVRHDLRTALYDHIQSLDIGQIEARELTEWLAIIEQDVNQVHSFIREGANPFFGMTTNLVAVGVTLVAVSPVLALTQLVMVPPLLYASKALLHPIRRAHRQARDDAERMTALLSSNLGGLSTIASFNGEALEAQRVHAASRRFTDSVGRAERIEAIYVPSLRAIAGGGFVTSLVWGSARAAQGLLSVGALNTLAMTQLRLLSALARMGYGLDQYQRTATALERIYTTLDLSTAIRPGPRRLAPGSVRGELRLQRVVFGYRPEEKVLRGIDLRIPAGATVGIVGASGAGKSTAMKLMLRFCDPQQGRVLLDGVDLRELSLKDLRDAIAYVAQDVTLFTGTIRENIAYGRPGAPVKDVVAAARVAEAHDFIMALPAQYETRLGPGELTLSGGQRQRLAIARAILADCPVLLFDEATSALDFRTEAALQRSLRAATAGRTTILVAHRLSTVRHADIIYVLEDGRVREHGTHEQLLAADLLYAGMWKIQTGERPHAARARPALPGPGAQPA